MNTQGILQIFEIKELQVYPALSVSISFNIPKRTNYIIFDEVKYPLKCYFDGLSDSEFPITQNTQICIKNMGYEKIHIKPRKFHIPQEEKNIILKEPARIIFSSEKQGISEDYINHIDSFELTIPPGQHIKRTIDLTETKKFILDKIYINYLEKDCFLKIYLNTISNRTLIFQQRGEIYHQLHNLNFSIGNTYFEDGYHLKDIDRLIFQILNKDTKERNVIITIFVKVK